MHTFDLVLDNPEVMLQSKKVTVQHYVICPQDGGQVDFLSRPETEVLFGGAAGPGKECDVHHIIPTPLGNKAMIDIHPGDYVFSDDGKPTRVIWESEIDFNPDAFEITFDNGEKITCDGRHLWKTKDLKDREKELRHSEEYRVKRKINRKSRAKENPKNKGSQKNVTLMNQNREYEYLELPTGEVRQTYELFTNQKVRGRTNFSVDITTAIELPEQELEIDPYVLGMWLGDGMSRDGQVGMLTQDFNEMLLRCNEVILSVKFRKQDLENEFGIYRLKGLRVKLKELSLLQNKHIPMKYLRSSKEQRIALLQGIMDTDGHIDKDGCASVGQLNKKLADDINELICSLGVKTFRRTKQAKLYGVKKKLHYQISFNPDFPAFQLKRKLERQNLNHRRKTNDKHYMVSIKKVPPVPMKCIQVANPSGMYLISQSFIPTHNSWALVIDALGMQYQYEEFGMAAYMHPKYRAVLFRRTSTRLTNLIDECKEYYLSLGAKFVLQRKGEPGSSFTFPSGSKIYLCHLEELGDVEAHQGAAYQYIGFDELTQFQLKQYLYLFSRLRGVVMNNGVSVGKRMRSTTNPTGEGLIWVKKRFIKHGRSVLQPGKTYFFISDPNVNDPDDNPQGIRVTASHPSFVNSKSRTFIPGFLFENRILMESDPGYAANIMQLGKKMEGALLHNDWDAFGGDFFDMFDTRQSKIKPFDIPDEWELYGSLDPGWSSPCAFCLFARDFEKKVYLLFVYYVRRKDPESHAKAIYKLIKEFPYTKGRMPTIIASGTDAFAHKDLHAVNPSDLTFANIFQDNGLYLQKAITDRVIGWWVMKQYFANNMFFFFDGYCESWVDEIIALQTDENNIEDIKGCGNDPNVPDHASDSSRYGLTAIPYPFTKAQKLLPIQFDKYGKGKKKKKDFTVMSA
jgi:hypothetical protein